MNHKNLPPLGPLISFCAAAKHQSFTKAAQELNLTHGAVSRAVKQLEDYFGLQLFQRRNRRIYLTDKGRIFAEQASEMLSSLETASEQMRNTSVNRHLSVSCEPSLAMRWLMPRLGNFYEHHPGIDVHLSTAGGPIDLAAQNLDLAIRRSDFQWPDDYWVTDLGKEFIGPVCHPEYWRRLEDTPATLLHTRTRPEAWSDWFAESNQSIVSSAEQYFDHFYFSLQAAVASLGLAIGPKPLVSDDIEKGHLVAPNGFVETKASYVVLSLKSPRNSESLQTFVAWLRDGLTS